jgi:hypothetical protein
MKITTAYRSEPGAGYGAEDHSPNDEDDIVNETTGGRWRFRARPRRAGVLAVTAGIVLLVAACGGGSAAGSGASASTATSPSTGRSASTSGSAGTTAGSAGSGGSSNTGGSSQAQQNIAFAQCMRSHGVTDFPDPDHNGQFGTISAQMEDSPQFGRSYTACKHLLPVGGESKGQQDAPQLLKFAQCMHAHGVPTYPEGNGPAPKYNIGNAAVDLLHDLGPGVNPNSPVVQRALQACERANPVGSR